MNLPLLIVIAIVVQLGNLSLVHASSSKISWEDFARATELPTATRALAANTPVSFVVDTRCAVKRLGSLTPGGLLNPVLAEGAKKAGSLDEYSVGIELAASVEFDRIAQAVSEETCIRLAGYDGEIEVTQQTAADPARPRQTHLDYLRFDQGIAILQPYLMIRKPVVIAIIDAGTDLSHPDLAVGIWRNMREVPANRKDDDGNGFVDDVHGYNFGSGQGDPRPQLSGANGAHGTHVAGLAASRWRNGVGGSGIGITAKIMAVNVFGPRPSTRSSVVENAIRYASKNGADVINLSLSGGEYSRTMSTALKYAVGRGSFVVSATGNEGLKFQTSPNLGIFFSPAAYGGSIQGMVSVASTDVNSRALSRFSNFNPAIVQLAAPGAVSSSGAPVGLYSPFPGGGYGTLAGTSMAAPLVSGAAALVVGYLKACGRSSSPAQVEQILLSGSPSNSRLLSYVGNGKELDILVLAQKLRSLGCR